MTGVPRQALDVTQQLDAGVRYLDLRIAHMLEGSEKNLHFVHMVYTTALVEVHRGLVGQEVGCQGRGSHVQVQAGGQTLEIA